MKRRWLALCASLLLMGLVPGSALAVVTPNGVAVTDQSQETNNKYFYGPATYGQTFKVGMAGSLTGVDLFMGAVSDTTVDVKIETLGRGTTYPLLPANVKAQGSITVNEGKWYHLDITPFNILVGSQFAIVFTLSDSNIYAYYAAGGASYPNGSACQLVGGSWGPPSAPADFAFRTYVGLPIPTLPPPNPPGQGSTRRADRSPSPAHPVAAVRPSPRPCRHRP